MYLKDTNPTIEKVLDEINEVLDKNITKTTDVPIIDPRLFETNEQPKNSSRSARTNEYNIE